MRRRALGALAAALLAAALAALVLAGLAAAQDFEARALAIERQLMCPRCVNERLDQCELAICRDMRAEIRDQLAAGRDGDEILLFFSDRYGQRVLADLPREGFNLVLFGWVGGSIAFVALAGAAALWRLRRASRPPAPAAAAASEADERWLDEQLRADGEDRGGGGDGAGRRG